VRRFVVWSSEEREAYPVYFGLPYEKFVFMPHHATLEGYPIETEKGQYIFSGGDASRDYDTLLKAVETLSVPTMIVAKQVTSWNGRPLPSHVTAKTTDPVAFRRLMAGSHMVVLPFVGGTLQSTGQQSYLNAMQLKKPVIVSRVPGVFDYIIPGVTGIVVPPGDPLALREAILRVLAGGPEIKRMVEAAYRSATQEFSLERFVDRLVGLVDTLERG
jgi:glycosyltransferase involved in cell wall biosynthesis